MFKGDMDASDTSTEGFDTHIYTPTRRSVVTAHTDWASGLHANSLFQMQAHVSVIVSRSALILKLNSLYEFIRGSKAIATLERLCTFGGTQLHFLLPDVSKFALR